MYTGSIRKRGKNKLNGKDKWQIVINLPRDPDKASRPRTYEHFEGTKTEANQRLQELLAEYNNGTAVKNTQMTVAQWLDQYMQLYTGNLAETTKISYEDKIRNHLKPALGKYPLSKLKTSDIQGMVNKMTDDGKSAKTVHNTVMILRPALNMAVEDGYLKKNPCLNVKLPKIAQSQKPCYNLSELSQVIAAAKGTKYELFVTLAALTGMRRGELIALRWSDVDFSNQVIHVERNTVRGKGQIITKSPKSAAGNRDIPFADSLKQLLEKEHTAYLKDKLRYGSNFTDSDLVIRQANGRGYSPDSASQLWERYRDRNHFKPISLHGLRHSFTSVMINNGLVDPKTAQTILGHSNCSITLNTYTHTNSSLKQQAANTVEHLVFEKASSED